MEAVKSICRITERYVLYVGAVTAVDYIYTAGLVTGTGSDSCGPYPHGSLCYRYWE